MSNIHLRNVDNHLIKKLKSEAARKEISVNTLILLLLNRSVGFSRERAPQIYHDIDKFAGTWNKQQAKEFHDEISHFEKIDKEIWK